MNIHRKFSLQSIFESKSEQVSVARCVAKGSIWQLDLKAHEMIIHRVTARASVFGRLNTRYSCLVVAVEKVRIDVLGQLSTNDTNYFHFYLQLTRPTEAKKCSYIISFHI